MRENKSKPWLCSFNQQLSVNRGRRQMREQLASVVRAVCTLGSSSLHPSPSPPAGPAGHQWEVEWPVLESSRGGRCPTVRQHTSLCARLLTKYLLQQTGKREGKSLAPLILMFKVGQSKGLMRRTETYPVGAGNDLKPKSIVFQYKKPIPGMSARRSWTVLWVRLISWE